AEVIAIARDYMASLDSSEIQRLPQACTPRRLRSARDVTSYAFNLVLYESPAAESSYKLLLDLAIFFSNASSRLRNIHGRPATIESEEVHFDSSVSWRRRWKEVRMANVRWEERLDAAYSESQVMEIARYFVASLDDREVARLPGPCQPRRLRSVDDIAAYALDLGRHRGSAVGEGDGKLVDAMAAFFAYAAKRLRDVVGSALSAPP
ncbi:MAG TPA: hypothetical protein VLS49_13065, partial [Usitatibacter sp.]|nr:hypothetical protein [Usitatibacter sp.]